MPLPGCGVIDLPDIGSNASAKKSKPLEVNDSVLNSKLAPPRGLSSKRLFNEKLGTADRFERLENVVQNLSDTLNEHLPSIQRLTAIEKEIEVLVAQLKTLVDSPQSISAPASVPVKDRVPLQPIEKKSLSVAKPPTQLQNPTQSKEMKNPKTPAETDRKLNIENIRISEDAKRTRVVFDSKGKINYKLEHDSAENLIIITVGNAHVSAETKTLARKSKKISDLQLQDIDEKKAFIITLNAAKSISNGTLLPPNSDSPYYRYFFDIQ